MKGENYQDLEAGPKSGGDYSLSKHRWDFIRKVYAIVTFQILLTVPVAAAVFFCPAIAAFLTKTSLGTFVTWTIFLASIIVLVALMIFRKQHPWNYVLLAVFTVCMALLVGLSCAFTSGKVVLEALILTVVIFLSLTLYTFWGARRGHDFSFLGPFLFASLIALIALGVIQILLPLGKVGHIIVGCFGILVFCGYIVYDTDELIKRYEFDDYIPAAIDLYLDIINLFLHILQVLATSEDSAECSDC